MTVSGLKEIFFDQVRDNFRVGLSGEAMSLFRQLFFQRNVIFYDSVVHHHDFAGTVTMRMRVFLGRAAVSGPAGMANSVGTIQRLEPDDLLQVAQFAFRAANLQTLAVTANGNTCGVIAAVFQTPQAV